MIPVRKLLTCQHTLMTAKYLPLELTVYTVMAVKCHDMVVKVLVVHMLSNIYNKQSK
jgi:hypothetical protein